jgi:hypothetical protein
MGLAPAMILKFVFGKVNIIFLLDDLPQKIIPHFIME